MTIPAFGNSDRALRITTLGSVRFESRGRETSAASIGPGKPLALVIYLTASPGRTATREHLTDLLWADVDPEAARHALRQTVWYLRQRVGDSLLTATRDLIRLGDRVETDRDDFLRAVQAQEYESAVGLYAGDFLPNLALPGGLEFEHWADLERQHLRTTFVRCGETLVRRWLSSARHREAITLAKRLRDTEPASEAVWRLLIEALLSGQDHFSAATEADALVRYLAADEREPEPATTAMIRAARSAPAASSEADKARVINTELIGRAEEFATLVAAWETTRAGRGQHLHVVAAAGVGKTRLIGDFAARLRARRARLAMVTLHQGDRSITYAALGEIASALCRLPGAAAISPASARALVALHPALSSVYAVEPDASPAHEAMRRRTLAVKELIKAVCEEGPLALIIDDLHWMDDASHRALANVLERVESHRALFVTTGRPRYASSQAFPTTQLVVRPLTPAQVGALVASLGSLPADAWAVDFVERLHAATGGTPLLVLETLQLLVEHGALQLTSSSWVSPSPEELLRVLGAGTAMRDRLLELPEADRRFLTTLAAAGAPATVALLSGALQYTHADSESIAARLEGRGFVVPVADGWQVVHDAVGEVAQTIGTPDDVVRAHRALGAEYLRIQPVTSAGLLRSATHLAQGGDRKAVNACFVQWLALLRRSGDPRPIREIAAEFVPDHPEAAPLRELIASAPYHLRFSRRHVVTASLGAAVVAATGVLLALRPAPRIELPDATLVAYIADSSGHRSTVALDVREADLRRQSVLELRDARPVAAAMAPAADAQLSPDGRQWASQRVFSDSGGIEIVITDLRSGRERRLTRSPSDDFGPSWSPDGAKLVIATGRFNHPLSHSDLAVLDIASGNVHQITSGDESDASPQWDPTGTRIAFSRVYWNGAPDGLCTSGMDGSQLSCAPIPGFRGVSVVGWYDDRRIVVLLDHRPRDDVSTLVLWDIGAHERRVIWTGLTRGIALSPDGRWVACFCSKNAGSPTRWNVFPMLQPELAREVIADRLGETPFQLQFLGNRRRDQRVARLSIRAPERALPTSAATQLQAVAFDRAGAPVSDIALRWTSLTPAIAGVDSESGLLIPHRAGRVRVRASAGGWIDTVGTMLIGDSIAQTVFSHDWASSSETEFVLYGDPQPTVLAKSSIGRALANNGDGSFASGAYTRRSFPGSAGLGAEAVVSTPITTMQWQTLSLQLDPDLDSTRLAAWDHRSGVLPGWSDNPRVGRCGAVIPGGEGYDGQSRIGAQDYGAEVAPLAARFRSGVAYRVRVQLFPDGRCGIAVNGHPMLIVRGRPIGDSRYHLVISGNSKDTNILVGKVEVWSGIKSDVSWLSVDSAARSR